MKNVIVVSFGRFQTPSVGHVKLFDMVYELSDDFNCDSMVFASHTQDKKRNPLSYDTKIDFLQTTCGSVVVRDTQNIIKNIFDVLRFCDGHYRDIVIVSGSDRYEEYATKLNHYNHREYSFENINVVCCGERNETNTVSGTMMREFVKNNDWESFLINSQLASQKEIRKLFDEAREVML